MAQRKINLTERADDDIHEIFVYLADISLAAAEAKIDMILTKIDLLQNFPRLGKVVETFRNERFRELIIGSYKVAYYIASETQIDILAVHHSSAMPGAPRQPDEE